MLNKIKYSESGREKGMCAGMDMRNLYERWKNDLQAIK